MMRSPLLNDPEFVASVELDSLTKESDSMVTNEFCAGNIRPSYVSLVPCVANDPSFVDPIVTRELFAGKRFPSYVSKDLTESTCPVKLLSSVRLLHGVGARL